MGQPHDGNSISPADPEAGTSTVSSRAPVGSQSLPESSHAGSSAAAGLVSRANTTPIGDGHHHSHGVHPHSSMFQQLVQPFQARPEDFDLDGKDASLEALEKWRRSSLVLNSARRFRYAADLKSRTKKWTPSFAQMGVAIAAVQKFKMGLNRAVDAGTKAAKAVGFGLGASQLSQIVEHQDLNALRAHGGLAGVAKSLCVDVVKGIPGDDADLEKRVQVYGRNTYPEKPAKPFWEFVWDAMQDFTLMILAVCSAVSLLVGIATEGIEEGWYDGAGIFLSILLVVLVTAISDYRQSLQFIELDKEKKKVFIPVIRNGQRVKVSVFDIVVGDVVMLSIGDVIPSDGVLIQGSSLVVDESSMTGESLPVRKNTTDHPFLLAGTKVQDGSGTFLTTGVGMQTEWGHLMAKLSDDGEEETPLQVKLSGVATLVGRIGLLVALLVFGVLMTRLLLSLDLLHKGWTMDDTLKVVDNFAVAVTIVVVAVPEGLPLAVTLSLAFAMKKMMADKALVRKLAACETMGSATTICSDKTGTLTANQMTVVRAWLYNSVRSVSLDDNVDLGASAQLQQLLRDAIFTNTSGDVQVDAATNKPVFLGSPTEMALLSLGVRLGGGSGGADSFQEVRRSTPTVKVDPFNSGRKRMGVAVQLPNGHVRVIWKGAAEIVIGMCNKVLTPSGEVVALNPADIDPILTGFTSDALRTLAFAYTDLPPNSPLLPLGFPSAPWDDDTPLPDSAFTLIAIAGIQDPLRPTAKIAVATCQSAGIMVRMVTGDNLSTAVAIARECGILTEGGEAIEGPKFRNLSPQEMRKLIPRLQVMARSSPTDKHTLVNELRAMGEVVAVTGDGTNDAPALKEADIGLAMGIAGTEVAKESADVVILDDNFQSIVNVAKWGRSVYTNIQKFVQFQLTVNLVALTTNFVAACVTGSAPLTAVQLLWVNLIMDTLGALALATEPPTNELMKRPPVGRRTPFISNIMWRNIIGQSVFQLVVLFVLQFAGIGLLGLDGADTTLKLNTIIFNTFVFCQVFNEINSREMEKLDVLSGVFTNSVFVGILAFTVIFQVIMVQFLCKFASTVPLSFHEFMLCVGLGAIALPVAVVVKFIPVPATPLSVLLHRRFVGAAPETPRGPDSTPLLAGRH